MQKQRPRKKQNKSETVVSNVATLDASNPIPFEYHNPNIFILKKERMFVPFFEGTDNFGELLLEAKLLSPTTLTCVNSKVGYCIGSGVYLKDTEVDDDFTKWAKNVNRKGQSLNDIIKMGMDNYFTWGNAFVEVIRGKIGSEKYVRIYVRPLLDTRLSFPDDDDICESVIISKNFRRKGVWTFNDDKEAVELPLYTFGGRTQEWLKQSGDERCIIHLKNEMSGYDYYGMPSNVASLPQEILEYKAARYNMDNFDNNLVIGGVIVMQGNMTQVEADKLGAKIVHQHSGDGKRGRYVILSSEQGIDDSKIIPFERQRDGDFIKFDERLEQKIIFANEWSKALIDPQTSGMGNSGKQIREIFEVKNNTVIKPVQSFFIQKLINPIMEICQEWMGASWAKHDFDIKTVAPLSFAGDIDVNAILTIDEGRDSIARPEMENGAGKGIIKPANNKKEVVDVPN